MSLCVSLRQPHHGGRTITLAYRQLALLGANGAARVLHLLLEGTRKAANLRFGAGDGQMSGEGGSEM